MKRPGEPRCTRRDCERFWNHLLVGPILESFSGLLCSSLDTFSGVFGRILGSVANVFGTRLRGLADFLSRMLNDVTGLGCSFVRVVGSILANRHTYAENQQCGNPC